MDKKLVHKKPSELTPYMNNPRVNDDAVVKVAESIQAFGFQTPILCTPEYEIIAGHTRWKAALKLDLKKIPVVVTNGLNDEQIKAYRIADNKLGELAQWDWEKLNIELQEIGNSLIEILDFNFEKIERQLPNLDPEQSGRFIDEEIIEKSKNKLDSRFNDEKETQLAMCPKCGHEFEVGK